MLLHSDQALFSACLSGIMGQAYNLQVYDLRGVAPCMQAAQELGLQLTPVKETLIDMAVTLIQLGIAKPRPKAA